MTVGCGQIECRFLAGFDDHLLVPQLEILIDGNRAQAILAGPRPGEAIRLAEPEAPAQGDVAVLVVAAGLGVRLISDEIYHGLEYGAPAPSMLQVTGDCFVLDGFSKRYAMTGFRMSHGVISSRTSSVSESCQASALPFRAARAGFGEMS